MNIWSTFHHRYASMWYYPISVQFVFGFRFIAHKKTAYMPTQTTIQTDGALVEEYTYSVLWLLMTGTQEHHSWSFTAYYRNKKKQIKLKTHI